jgi:hypothetical protein
MNDKMDKSREGWEYRHAGHLVTVALAASASLPRSAQHSLLRTIARLAIEQLPNAPFEASELAKAMRIENMKRPRPRD